MYWQETATMEEVGVYNDVNKGEDGGGDSGIIRQGNEFLIMGFREMN